MRAAGTARRVVGGSSRAAQLHVHVLPSRLSPMRLPTARAALQIAQLQKLRELLLAREPQLLDTYIDELAFFQVR